MSQPLRIVAFNVYPDAYELVAGWAREQGHKIVLLVTPATDSGDRYGDHQTLVDHVPDTQDILVTNRLRKTAVPVIRALEPDLIVSATYTRRIPAEVTVIPRYGAVNLHPAPLPRGRGPNPQRLIYEGDLHATGALHRIEPEIDAGAVLSMRTQPLPADFRSEDIFQSWFELLQTVLDEGVRRAVAGEWGDEQDHSQASYAGHFTEEEMILDFREPASTILRRLAALNLLAPLAQARIDGELMSVAFARRVAGTYADYCPGTVLDRSGTFVTVQTGDGVLSLVARSAQAPAHDEADLLAHR